MEKIIPSGSVVFTTKNIQTEQGTIWKGTRVRIIGTDPGGKGYSIQAENGFIAQKTGFDSVTTAKI